MQHEVTHPPAALVRIQVLGDFAVVHAGRPVPVRQCGQRVLAFLGLQAGPVPRSRLAGSLWPCRAAEQASANLRAALSRLPRPAGRPMTSSQDAAVALSEHVEVDLRLSDGRIRRLRTGDGAPDTTPEPPPDDAPAGESHHLLDRDVLPFWDDDWVLVERERFRQARLHALERLSARLLAAGRLDEALQAALAAVAGEPLRESAHRHVIEVHLCEGNPAEALRQYEIYRRLLREELGLGPSDRIRQLVRSLLGRPGEDEPG